MLEIQIEKVPASPKLSHRGPATVNTCQGYGYDGHYCHTRHIGDSLRGINEGSIQAIRFTLFAVSDSSLGISTRDTRLAMPTNT